MNLVPEAIQKEIETLENSANSLKGLGFYNKAKEDYISIVDKLKPLQVESKSDEIKTLLLKYVDKAEKVKKLEKEQLERTSTENKPEEKKQQLEGDFDQTFEQKYGNGDKYDKQNNQKSNINYAKKDINKKQTNVSKNNKNDKDKKPKEDLSKLDEFEKKMYEELVEGDSIKVSFKDLHGLKHVEEKIQDNVILPEKRPDLFDGIRQPVKGILLFGPPGNGKTMIAKAIAHECQRKFFAISASSLTGKWVGDNEKSVRALFSVSAKFAPSVIFLDEIDSILTKRSSNENEASRKMKTEFLVQMDGVQSNKSDGGRLIIAATNRPSDLDDALLRRFPLRIQVDLPTTETLQGLLTAQLEKTKSEMNAEEINKVALFLKQNMYSCSDTVNVIREAAMLPLKDQTNAELLSVKKEDVRGIQVKDFHAALKSIRPSVDQSLMNQYTEFKDNFGC